MGLGPTKQRHVQVQLVTARAAGTTCPDCAMVQLVDVWTA